MSLFRVSIVFLAVLSISGLGCNGCHEEPTIIIRFEPTDADVKPSPVAVTAPAPTPTPAPRVLPPVKHAKKECKADTDCEVVPEDCCDCANGGRQQALPKSRVAAFKAERGKRCGKVMCTMMFSTDPTCGMRAQCQSGQCVMTKKN
jgi:hypothetical protein